MPQVIGNNTLLGTPASIAATSPKLLYGTTQQVVLAAGQKLTSVNVGWGGKSINPTGSPNFEVGIYDVSGSNVTTAPLLYSLPVSFNNADHTLPAHWISFAIDVDFSAHAGKTLAVGISAPPFNQAFDILLGTVSGASRKNGTGNSQVLLATMATGTVSSNQAWSVYIETADAAPTQAITSINSGAGITPGSTGNTASHTGFSGVPTAMTFGGKAATNIAGNATSSTFDFPYYVDLETYPQPGTSPNFIATLGAESATLAAPLNYPAGMTGVTVSSPDTTNDKKLGYWILQAGRTITNGDMLIYTIADVTGSADSGFTAASPVTTVIWHWIQSTGVMYQYNATITEAGITEATGLTVRGLSVSGLGVRGLTVRGLGGVAAMAGGFPYLLPFLLS